MGGRSRFLFSLGYHSKQAGNEPGLMLAVSFVYSLHLLFPNHVPHLVALQGSPRYFEGEEAKPWLDESLDEAMILFNQGVEVLALPQYTRCWNGTRCFQVVESLGRGSVFIDRDDARGHRVGGPKRFRQKPLGSLGIAGGTEPELQRVALGVHRSKQIHRHTLHLDRGFVDAPGIGRRFQARVGALPQFGGIALDRSGRWSCDQWAILFPASFPPGHGSSARSADTNARTGARSPLENDAT